MSTVAKHSQLRFSCSIPGLRFVYQSRILFPCLVCSINRVCKQVRSQTQRLQHIGLTDTSQTEVIKYQYSGLAALVQFTQPCDKRLDSSYGRSFPSGCKFFGSHAGDSSELSQLFSSSCHSFFNLIEGLCHSSTTSLGLDTNRRHSRSQSHQLSFRKTSQFTTSSQSIGHSHNLRLSGSKIVTQINDCCTEPRDILAGGAHYVHHSCNRSSCIFRAQVGCISQHNHGLRELKQTVCSTYTQLTSHFHNTGNLRGRLRHNPAHLFDSLAESSKFFFCGINCFTDSSKCGLKVDRCFRSYRPQSDKRNGDILGQSLTGRGERRTKPR